MRKRERKLRGASGGHARAKSIAKRKLAAAESKNGKLRKRVRKLKTKNASKTARIKALKVTTAKLQREIAIDGLRSMHVIRSWQKLYEAERTQHEVTQDRLAKVTDAHLVAKHELRLARRELRARA